ncbi:hypothetical protein BJV77DRAFT_1027253 [Russula vinacea]|nr:hypothetical protein BJV77DRAFT_1027253 [Russula vinacea]
MDVSPKFEASLWEASYTELSNQFRDKLLPPSHVITQHVHDVVSRILNANDLGTLRSDPQTPITPPRMVVQQPSLGGFGGGDGEEGAPDLWDPDANATGWRTAAQGKEWKLLVVNDQKVVNAMAAPGTVVVLQGYSLPVEKAPFALEYVPESRNLIVVARHTAERYSYSKVIIAFAWLAELIGLPYGFGNILTTLLMELPHSRQQEYEADKIGLKLSAKACYDPTAAPSCGSCLSYVSLLFTLALHRMFKRLEAFSIQSSACGGTSDYIGGFGEAVASGLGSRTPWDR